MEFVFTIMPTTRSLGTVRLVISEWMRHLRLDPGFWPLISTELVNNAIEHAPTEAPISLRLEPIPPHHLRLQVENEGRQDFDVAATGPEGPLTPGGRGLKIVRGLTDSLDVEVSDARTIVSCVGPAEIDHQTAAG